MMLVVREMRPTEVQIRIDYFHSASTEYLHMPGVEPGRLPAAAEWLEQYQRDAARPREQRAGFHYLETIMAAPSPINYRQPVTPWVLEGGAAAGGAA
jgi:hypothetical protein